MGLVIAVPVMDQHDLTNDFLESLADTVAVPEMVTVVIIDNDSERPYPHYPLYHWGFEVHSVRNDENRGYYYPILQARKFATPGDIVGLMHNDVLIYEKGWDQRVTQAFVQHSDLGMIGFVGSDELDDRGGRGGGTMCFFRGEKGQDQSCGKRVTDLHPANVLDSVVMLIREPAIDALKVDENIQLCHFGDRVWPLRLYEAGWKTAVLGVEMDHRGGMTAVANPRYHESARKWCEEHGVDPGNDPSLAVYLDAESKFLTEYRAKGYIPSRMQGWNLVRA